MSLEFGASVVEERERAFELGTSFFVVLSVAEMEVDVFVVDSEVKELNLDACEVSLVGFENGRVVVDVSKDFLEDFKVAALSCGVFSVVIEMIVFDFVLSVGGEKPVELNCSGLVVVRVFPVTEALEDVDSETGIRVVLVPIVVEVSSLFIVFSALFEELVVGEVEEGFIFVIAERVNVEELLKLEVSFCLVVVE